MSGTSDIVFTIGDKYWCVLSRLQTPLLGTIVALTDIPGKLIGLEFSIHVNGHTCDGCGHDGKCLWVTPESIYNQTEWKSINNAVLSQMAFEQAIKGNSFEEIIIDTVSNKILNEAINIPVVQRINEDGLIVVSE